MELFAAFLFASFLRAIPQSNQAAQSIGQLAAQVGADAAQLYGAAQMLRAFGIVQIVEADTPANAQVQATSQTAKYALNSLASYIEHEQPIVPDWKLRGFKPTVLANGASFLHELEAQRMALLPDAAPTRQQDVAVVLIKRAATASQPAAILFQYDADARRYQLIGGRHNETDDTMQATIVREIAEELPANTLQQGQDYDLQLLVAEWATQPILSPTFGALTSYRFWIYHMQGLRQPLTLGSDDRWLTLDEIAAGRVTLAHTLVDVSLRDVVQALDEAGITLADLPASFAPDVG